MIRKISALSLFLLLFVFGAASAHQPRLVKGGETVKIENPEISQAFYGELDGRPQFFRIESDQSFELYVGVLSPVLETNVDMDFSLEVVKAEPVKGAPEKIVFLDGMIHRWERYYEPYGGDSYWQGPEETLDLDSGIYDIQVFSFDNRGKYVLAVGNIESFPMKEMLRALVVLPGLKVGFFEKSIFSMLWSRIFLFILLSALVVSWIASVISRRAIKRIRAKKKK